MDTLIDKSKINISQTIILRFFEWFNRFKTRFSFYFRNTIINADWMFIAVRKLFTIKNYSSFQSPQSSLPSALDLEWSACRGSLLATQQRLLACLF